MYAQARGVPEADLNAPLLMSHNWDAFEPCLHAVVQCGSYEQVSKFCYMLRIGPSTVSQLRTKCAR